jgi:aspartate/methionine/tyrosine aminotransferase
MKAAWIAALGPDPLLAEALTRLEIIADTFLSTSAPVQLAVPHWVQASAAIQQQILARVRHNLELLQRFAAHSPGKLRVIAPEAGWAAVISLPSCGGDPNCAERLVREHQVIVHPGAFYGMAERNRAVVSLLVEPATIEAALDRI